MEKSSIARYTGGGGNEPQGRQGFLSKIPFFKFFSKSKFSVSVINKYYVGVKPQHTLNCVGLIGKRSIINLQCHPELAAPLVADEKEAYKGGCSQSISGSSHQQKCVTICTVSGKEVLDKVGWAFSPTLKYCCVRTPNLQKADSTPSKAAFTLAEVLITLGIIGIVAAMTLPTIISKYKRQVVEVKLQKFYSIMNQAVTMSLAEHNDIPLESQHGENSTNAAYIENWYKTYITKYIKLIKEEGVDVSRAYYRVAFLDGSGFNSYFSSLTEESSNDNLYIFFCLNYSKCDRGRYDGSNSFLFIYDRNKPAVDPIFATSSNSIEGLKNQCYNIDTGRRWGCAALIMKNGWKIPDDYPWL